MAVGARAESGEAVFQVTATMAIPSYGSIHRNCSVTQSGVAQWTNRSVLRFAADQDPIKKMEDCVREIVMRARDAGWRGPPFNPVALAQFLNIPVDPTTSVVDARTVPGKDGVRIQYNPQQSRARTRFSIAHEIAHALFEDVADVTRHRGGDPTISDDWQLEMLCNLAAAEIVLPIGSLPTREGVPPIEALLRERLDFDVSVEAYLMRTTKVAVDPVSMFIASPRLADGKLGYHVDYAVGSASAPQLKIRGKSVPAKSVVRHCTAIGATSHGTENWLTNSPVRLEAVGIPGYPGSTWPRVAVLVRHSHAETGDLLHFVQGDVLEPRPYPPEIICQVVNDKASRWGGGLAKQSAKKYPAAENEFCEWIKSVPRDERLGEVHYAKLSDDRTLASLIAQEGFGTSSAPRIKYRALDKGLRLISDYARRVEASVHMPRLGAGGAGGDWTVIEAMIRSNFAGLKQGVWIYDLPPARPSQLDLLGL